MSRKPYIKPQVSKLTITSKILRMIDAKGFREVFYEELQERRKTDPRISERAIFDLLNKDYYDIFNKYRYADYNSFKQLK